MTDFKAKKAIIFDYDNTLADRTLATFLTYSALLEEFAPQLVKGSIEREAMLQDLMIWDMFGNYSKQFCADNLEKRYGIKLPIPITDWWVNNQHNYEDLFPEAIDTLVYLRSKGYKLGVLTNGISKSQRAKVERVGLEKYVDCIVICGDHDFQKPAKAAFDYVCNEMGVDASESVYIGDIYSNDVYGSFRAGLTPIWIWPDGKRLSNNTVTRISNLEELKDIF